MHNTVDFIFNWKKDSNQQSVEEKNKSNTYVKEWKYRDVMYSFYGIYAMGLLVYYPDIFESTNCTIRLSKNNSGDKLYDYILKNHSKYTELNELKELRDFIEVYDSVGNVIPVWPGANEHRGYKSKCLDLPDIYFKRHFKWTQHLIDEYPEAIIENLHRSSYPDTMKDFLELMKIDGEYQKFLTYVIDKIKYRTSKLMN